MYKPKLDLIKELEEASMRRALANRKGGPYLRRN
jgi:hypothetical protein